MSPGDKITGIMKTYYQIIILSSCCMIAGLPMMAFAYTAIDNQALKLFTQGNYHQSAEHFKDDYRKGVAYYRAGDYKNAVIALSR